MRKTFGMNPHQKAVYRPKGKGERRAGREQIAELLEKSSSENADERCEAAENLCPCHVRKRIEPVWEALYRMLEDSDVRVRRAAWHTLEDGGTPEDPALDAIIARVRQSETDKQVLNLLRQVAGSRDEREMHTIKGSRPGKAHPARQVRLLRRVGRFCRAGFGRDDSDRAGHATGGDDLSNLRKKRLTGASENI
jgi:hypothetical protein